MLHFEPWKIWVIGASILISILYTIPNFLNKQQLAELPSWLQYSRVNLGLDLQGGSQLLLEVDMKVVHKERTDTLLDDIRANFREKKIGYLELKNEGRAVSFKLRDLTQLELAKETLTKMSRPVAADLLGQGGDNIEYELAEDGRAIVRHSEVGEKAHERIVIEQSVEIVRRRVDEFGTNEPVIQQAGEGRILVELPGVDNPERLKQLLGKTAKLTFHLVNDNADLVQALAGRAPAGYQVLFEENGGNKVPVVIERKAIITGEMLVSAQPGFDQLEPAVLFRFDAIGSKRFGDVTSVNVGRRFAIVLDGKVISAPVIRDAILGGSGQITGQFTVESANDLAVLLRAGALPAPMSVLEQRTVGPGLGADSIRAGAIASVIAIAAVSVFMIIAYGTFGFIAVMALMVNLSMIVALLAIMGATLTLPGIAGIVLIIGMAVDANVLIFERMKEERSLGKTPVAAMDAGYSRALSSILDSNITTLIAAFLLLFLGSGPIRGFAVTLGIGIVTSVYAAYMVTRLFLVLWFHRVRPKELPL